MAGERTKQSAVQVLGLSLMLAAITAIPVVSLILGETAEVGMFAVVLAIFGAIVYVAWRYEATWAKVVGLVETLAAGLLMFWLAFGIFQFFSPIEFTVGLTFTLGFFLSLIGGIRAIMASRKGDAELAGEGAVLRNRILTIIGAAAVISIVGFFVTKETVDEAAAAGAVSVEMTGFEFAPSASSVAAGGKLLVHNADPFAHDFTVPDLDIGIAIGPGSETLVDLSSAAPGTYNYYCTLHSSSVTDADGMIGQLTIGS